MQRVFIYACENSYGGLHGIEDMTVTEVSDLKVADEIGRDMSLGVIESYGLAEEYEEEDEVEYDTDENTCWEIYKIKDGICISTSELDAECCNLGKEGFIEEYCEKEMWEEE